jgi:hypothetical protein
MIKPLLILKLIFILWQFYDFFVNDSFDQDIKCHLNDKSELCIIELRDLTIINRFTTKFKSLELFKIMFNTTMTEFSDLKVISNNSSEILAEILEDLPVNYDKQFMLIILDESVNKIFDSELTERILIFHNNNRTVMTIKLRLKTNFYWGKTDRKIEIEYFGYK